MKFVGTPLQLLILLAVVFIVLAPVAPLYEPMPFRDQGVYLYVGQRILDGDIPYRDVWDHKGPLVYYINALGLLLTGSTWGVWLIEVVFLFLAAIFGFFALRLTLTPTAAFLAALLWLAAFPDVSDHGNSVEEYSLLFQFAAVYFFLRGQKNAGGWLNEFLVGVSAALVFSLRPNNIGIHLAVGLILAAGLFSPAERSRAFKRIVAAAAGSGVVFAVIAVYFAAHRALGDLFDQVFVFNYYYSRLETFSWQALAKGYELMPALVVGGLLGLAGAALYLWSKGGGVPAALAALALVAAPIQLYLALLSGRKYMHYYIAWLPVLAILAGFAIYQMQRIFPAGNKFRKPFDLILTLGLILAFASQPVLGRAAKAEALLKTVWEQKSLPAPDYASMPQGEYLDYISSHTQPGDYVLIWGNASVYNFLSKRESPSRFVYTYAFGVPAYVTRSMADELQADIAEKKPLILDATYGDKTIPRIDSTLWDRIPATQGLTRFIEENYIYVDTIGADRFRVWVPK